MNIPFHHDSRYCNKKIEPERPVRGETLNPLCSTSEFPYGMLDAGYGMQDAS